MKSYVSTICYCLLALIVAENALAHGTPSGLWKTFDEDTNKEISLVRITQSSGVYMGIIEKLLNPAIAKATCTQCTDKRKNMPVLGMVIISDVRKSTDNPSIWAGGTVLEIKKGKTYKVQLTLSDGGRTLEVRGYVGTPFMGRTQRWQRVE